MNHLIFALTPASKAWPAGFGEVEDMAPELKPFFLACAMGLAGMPARATDSLLLNQDGFTVLKRSQNGSDWTYILSDTKAGSSLEVYQEGANLKKFIAKVNGVSYSVFNSNGNWKMMPWANRTKGGRFTDAQGVARDLMINQGSTLLTTREPNGNAIHGMVRARLWNVQGFGVDEEGVYLRCNFDTQGFASLEALFGAFRDNTVYHLQGNRLLIDAFTENKSDKPFDNCGWGFHPWVNAPLLPVGLPKKGTQADCAFIMPAKTVATVDGDKIPIGTQAVSAFSRGYFDFTRLRSLKRDTATDHYFTDLSQEGTTGFSRSVLIDYANSVRVQFMGQLPFYPWMVIYIPGNDVICIEHQTQEVNGLNTKQHLIKIPARSRSPVGRIWVEVDGDTTLAFQGPVAVLPDAKPGLAIAGMKPKLRRVWEGGNLFIEVPRPGKKRGWNYNAAGASIFVEPPLSEKE